MTQLCDLRRFTTYGTGAGVFSDLKNHAVRRPRKIDFHLPPCSRVTRDCRSWLVRPRGHPGFYARHHTPFVKLHLFTVFHNDVTSPRRSSVIVHRPPRGYRRREDRSVKFRIIDRDVARSIVVSHIAPHLRNIFFHQACSCGKPDSLPTLLEFLHFQPLGSGFAWKTQHVFRLHQRKSARWIKPITDAAETKRERAPARY